MSDDQRMARLRELIADQEVQVWPEQVDGGFLKLLEMRNLITELMPRLVLVGKPAGQT